MAKVKVPTEQTKERMRIELLMGLAKAWAMIKYFHQFRGDVQKISLKRVNKLKIG